jgi:hypothetical protein
VCVCVCVCVYVGGSVRKERNGERVKEDDDAMRTNTACVVKKRDVGRTVTK